MEESSTETTLTLRSLNALAISYLASNNYQASICALHEALARARSSLLQAPGHAGEEVTLPFNLAGSNEVQRTQICIPVGGSSLFDVQSISARGPVFCLFDRAFALPSNAGDNRTFCTLLYNLALSHSLVWCESESAEELQLAIELYRISLSTAESMWAESNDDFVVLQLLAIFNNLGYLHSQQKEPSQASVKAICHSVNAIQALLSSREVTGSPHQEDIVFFRWSCLFLFNRRDQDMAPAA